jgi:signal transduction histidine kinase
MAGPVARLAPKAWLRAPRPTARLRLTLLYGTLFLVSGAALLGVTYLLAAHATTITPGPGRGRVAGGPRTPSAAGRYWVHLTPSQKAYQQGLATELHGAVMHKLLIGSGITLAVMAVISIALGWLVAGRVLRPVRTISATARRISASNLHERLSRDGPDDEFRELAATLDNLLDRLQASFDSQRRFVASASHELRTPLTLDRALLERALRNRQPTQASWRATCERLLASSQQQDRLIEALLTLARSEGAVSRHELFELGGVIDSVLLSPELDAANMGLHIQADIGQAPVSGDPRLVERLVRNLVDNAIRYNQPSGSVDIAAATQADRAILVIANTGPSILPADIDRLFQPFQRLAPNRSSHADGTGLGLSIAKAIADAHDATITAAPQPHGGLKIQVSFPAWPERERALVR